MDATAPALKKAGAGFPTPAFVICEIVIAVT